MFSERFILKKCEICHNEILSIFLLITMPKKCHPTNTCHPHIFEDLHGIDPILGNHSGAINPENAGSSGDSNHFGIIVRKNDQ
jgi:hypothetical protein